MSFVYNVLTCFVSIKSTVSSIVALERSNTTDLYCGNCTSYYEDDIEGLIETFKNEYPVVLWERYGLFKEEFLVKINKHWLKFPPPSENTHYFLAGLYIAIMTSGMLGNALVVFMIARCKALRTPANILVMNLAISDFLIMSEMPIFVFNSFHRGPALGEQVCRYYGFIGGLSGTVSIVTLAAISLDRYYVIKYPLNRRFTNLRAKVCVVVTWVYGAVFAAIPLLEVGLGTYVPEGYLTSCSYDYLTEDRNARLFILVFFVAAWVAPFVMISYCYATIFYVATVKRRFRTDMSASAESSRHVKQEERRKQETKLALVVFLVIGLWFAAWTPYAVVSLLGIAGRKDLIHPFYSMIPALFCKSASCADPFVYAFTHPRFKEEIRKALRKSDVPIVKKVWTVRIGDSADGEVEMVTLDSAAICQRRAEMPESVVSGEQMLVKHATVRKPWWYRPSFSNRASSVRYLKRSFSKECEKRDVGDEEPDYVTY